MATATYQTPNGAVMTARQARAIIEQARGHSCVDCEYADCATTMQRDDAYYVLALAEQAGDFSGARYAGGR